MPDFSAIEKAVLEADLASLSARDRMLFYNKVCDSLGLNPLTQPFEYIKLNGKLRLYAKRDCTDQLRRIHAVSVVITSREFSNGVYVVSARATIGDSRTDESIGAVSVDGLRGEALANAYMKAETKAKRRVTLSIVGLGWLDETEIETIPSAERVTLDTPSPNALPATESEFSRILRKMHDADSEETLDAAKAHAKAFWRQSSATEKEAIRAAAAAAKARIEGE